MKTILIAAVDDAYIRSLRDKYIGYANVTTLEMLTHLYDSYARITQGDLDENDRRMKQAWDPNQPFETLIDQIEDAIDFSAAGNTPYSRQQIVNAAYNAVFRTGLFADDCKTWRKRPEADKTWDNFKADFTTAHQDLRESQITAGSAGFQNQANFINEHNVSNVADSVEALAAITELANASNADRNAISKLTETNSALCKELIITNAKLVVALERITELERPNRATTSSSRNRHYCWSCGSNSNHSSKDCNNKKEGHVDSATEKDKKGGSTARYPARK